MKHTIKQDHMHASIKCELILLLLTTISSICPASQAETSRSQPETSSSTATASNVNGYSNYVLSVLNKDRSDNGSPILQNNQKLDQLAQTYAEYLLRTGTFAHIDPFGRNPQDRADYFGIKASISENLAWESSNYQGASILIQHAEKAMMSEPPNQLNHRFNILNPQSRYVGIGVARAGDKIMIVEEFSGDDP